MSISSGYLKFKRFMKQSDNTYKLVSFWTSSNTVEMGNGNTLETNLGAITGITSSLASTSNTVALTASAGKSLQDQITGLNSDIANLKNTFIPDYEGNIAYDSNNQVVAQGVMVKRNDGKCDIHLNISILVMNNRSSNEYRFISKSAICIMFGVNSLSWEAAKTRVSNPYSTIDGIGNYTGYTGLLLTNGDDFAGLGRWYTGDGQIGGWATNQPIFNIGILYNIDIWGAYWS